MKQQKNNTKDINNAVIKHEKDSNNHCNITYYIMLNTQYHHITLMGSLHITLTNNAKGTLYCFKFWTVTCIAQVKLSQ